MPATGVSQERSARIESWTSKFDAVFPALGDEARHLAKTLYDLLALGEPVATPLLAAEAQLPLATVDEILDSLPGVFQQEGSIVGFWGLTPFKMSKHRFEVGGRQSYVWCALDSLFIPAILGQSAEVESRDPETGEVIRLRVTENGVENLEPAATVMSILEPTPEMTDDVVTRFCHFVYFFASPDSGAKFVAKNPGTSLMAVDEAFVLGKKFSDRLVAPG